MRRKGTYERGVSAGLDSGEGSVVFAPLSDQGRVSFCDASQEDSPTYASSDAVALVLGAARVSTQSPEESVPSVQSVNTEGREKIGSDPSSLVGIEVGSEVGAKLGAESVVVCRG